MVKSTDHTTDHTTEVENKTDNGIRSDSAPDSSLKGEANETDTSPEFRGLTGEEISEKQRKGRSRKVASNDPVVAVAQEYAKLYPTNQVFHITSDKQVFLQDDLNLAVMHQNSLDNGEHVKSINIK